MLHVLAPNFLGGALPEFLDWDYKIQPHSDHVAKFQGDLFRDLGELVAKKIRLDEQGKARREAARRRNSECKINFRKTNSSRSNGRSNEKV